MKKKKPTKRARKQTTKTKVQARSVVKKKKAKRVRPGQPTKYKTTLNNQALILAEKGFTDKDIGEVFGVTTSTLDNWKKKYPQFFASLKKGKEVADHKVVQSLYQRALGYSHPEIHISNHKGSITKTNIIKHYAPDTTACIFWLKNRDKDNWRDKTEHEHAGKDGKPLEVNVTVTKTYKAENGNG